LFSKGVVPWILILNLLNEFFTVCMFSISLPICLTKYFMRSLQFILFLLFFTNQLSHAQALFENGQFWHSWTDSSEITLLQARQGSRFSFSLSTKHKGFYQGSIGMDNDNFSQWLCGIESDGKSNRFSTSMGPSSFKKMEKEEYGMNCLSTSLRGTGEGISLEWKQFSAWEPFMKIQDSVKLKFNTAPFYVWNLRVNNNQTSKKSVVLYLGQNSIPVDPDKGVNLSWWRINKPCERIYFRDPSGKLGLMALSSIPTNQAVLFEKEGFYGMKISLELKPGEEVNLPFVWAAHQDEAVLTDEKHNEKLYFSYRRFFKNVDEVSDYGLSNIKSTQISVARFEDEIAKMPGNSAEKWLASLTFRTDIANGLLVTNPAGKYFWFETEGRFRHMNTLDVAFETQVLARYSPWRLRMLLDQWAGYIAQFEEWIPSSRTRTTTKDNLEGVSASETGAFVYHDVGNFPFVMKAEGYDFGPYLPVEENAIFIHLMYYHWKLTNDKAFVQKYAGLVAMLMQSLQNRDSNGNGLADVGHGWSTYDVSEAIKRAPDNTYAGVKMAVAYLLGSELLKQSVVTPIRSIDQELITKDQDGTTMNGTQKAEWEKGTIGNAWLREKQAKQFENEAAKIIETLKSAQKKHGFVPVSLDTRFTGWNQQISVLAEGLLYSSFTGFEHPTLTKLKAILKPEWNKALPLCTKPYGLTISSSEPVTWFSKTMVMDYVATKALGFTGTHSNYPFRWNLENDQAYQDGATSLTEAWPGNWYPRGLSAWLYLLR